MLSVKKLRLFWLFYSGFYPATLLVSILCGLIMMGGGMETFVYIFWFKVITTASILYYMHDAKRAEFFYYQNLGLSKALLFILAVVAELLAFVLLVTLGVALFR